MQGCLKVNTPRHLFFFPSKLESGPQNQLLGSSPTFAIFKRLGINTKKLEEKKKEFNLVEKFSLAVVFPMNSHLHLRDTPFGFTANLYDQRWTSTGFFGRIFWHYKTLQD